MGNGIHNIFQGFGIRTKMSSGSQKESKKVKILFPLPPQLLSLTEPLCLQLWLKYMAAL